MLRQPTGPDGTNGFSLKRTFSTNSTKSEKECLEENDEDDDAFPITNGVHHDLQENKDGLFSVGSEQEVRKIPSQELPSAERIDEQVAALSVS